MSLYVYFARNPLTWVPFSENLPLKMGEGFRVRAAHPPSKKSKYPPSSIQTNMYVHTHTYTPVICTEVSTDHRLSIKTLPSNLYRSVVSPLIQGKSIKFSRGKQSDLLAGNLLACASCNTEAVEAGFFLRSFLSLLDCDCECSFMHNWFSACTIDNFKYLRHFASFSKFSG